MYSHTDNHTCKSTLCSAVWQYQLCNSEKFWEQTVRQRCAEFTSDMEGLATAMGWRKIFFTLFHSSGSKEQQWSNWTAYYCVKQLQYKCCHSEWIEVSICILWIKCPFCQLVLVCFLLNISVEICDLQKRTLHWFKDAKYFSKVFLFVCCFFIVPLWMATFTSSIQWVDFTDWS